MKVKIYTSVIEEVISTWFLYRQYSILYMKLYSKLLQVFSIQF